MSSVLNEKLKKVPVRADAKYGIVNRLWGRNCSEEYLNHQDASLDVFFDYYEDQCCQSQSSVETHSEILEIVEYFKNGNETRENVRCKLGETASEADEPHAAQKIDASIALAIRLWLMVHVGSIGPVLALGNTQIKWTAGTV